ncbi:MAG TPA: ankyrin repeat domain-containing protein, partial [Beijerinckiaceae bacterium]|nr:ankyrin repeat domain-containing protein [Beijerinckiaceae bacterium]
KFIRFVADRNVDPDDKELAVSLLKPFEAEIENAAPPTAREMIKAVEADNGEQVAALLERGLDPARVVLRPDPPSSRGQLQDLQRLASDYGAAESVTLGGHEITRGRDFVEKGLQKVFPSLAELVEKRPKHPGRNMLTLALACKAGKVVDAICLWVVRQREAGKPCDLPNRPDGQGCTPLTMAVEAGDLGAVKLLLDLGADINRPNTRPIYGDKTPLMIAIEKQHGAMVSLLLMSGANLLAIGPDGSTALSLAAKTKDAAVLEPLLAALSDRLQQMAQTIKGERRTTGASEKAPRFAAAVKEIDDLMEEAMESGDIALQKLVRPCHEFAHGLQTDDPFEALYLRIKLYKQDPQRAPSELLLASLRQAPDEWGRRLDLTDKHAPNDAPIHSEDLERFYAELSGLARGAADPELSQLANKCIRESFDCCSTRGNLHDGAKLLELMERDESAVPDYRRKHENAALACLYRTLWLFDTLAESTDGNVNGTHLVASLARAEVALLKLLRYPQQYYQLSIYLENRGGFPTMYSSDYLTWACSNFSPDDLTQTISLTSPVTNIDRERNDRVGSSLEGRVAKIGQASSKGSAGNAAGLFLDAFRIATQILHKGIPSPWSTPSLINCFCALTAHGKHHALNQMSEEEFATFSASLADQTSREMAFRDSSAFKAVQDFHQGRVPRPPAADSALFSGIITAIHDIQIKHVDKPELRANAVGAAIAGRIRQFIADARPGESEQVLTKREASAQAFADVLSMALPPEQRMAVLGALSARELLTVRSWFDEENDTTRAIDAIYAERKA